MVASQSTTIDKILEIEDLTVNFDGFKALNNLNSP
jgi:ABC-type uncharacterized transport system ATPase subunit